MKVECFKSLYKTTYDDKAFVEGAVYEVVSEDDHVWVRDRFSNPFSFVRVADGVSYVFSDYFVEKE